MKDLTVILPCYKEDPDIVLKTYNEVQSLGCKVIVVNDGNTVDLHQTIQSINYVPNMGYGYALKKGIEKADTDLVLTMDSDGEHRAEDVIKLYNVFKMVTKCDMVVGCRWNKKEKWYRWIGRKSINFIASSFARHYLIDLNSGMRIFRRELAISYKSILCDTFSFTTSLTMCMVTDNYKVAWFPIDTNPRTFGKSHVRLVRDGLITVWYIFYIGFALRTRKIRAWLRHIVGR